MCMHACLICAKLYNIHACTYVCNTEVFMITLTALHTCEHFYTNLNTCIHIYTYYIQKFIHKYVHTNEQEAGADSKLELAFTLADGLEYVKVSSSLRFQIYHISVPYINTYIHSCKGCPAGRTRRRHSGT